MNYHQIRLFLAIILICAIPIISQSSVLQKLRKNQRVSGSPHLVLDHNNLSKLPQRTAHLIFPNRHYLQKTYNIGETQPFYAYDFAQEKYVQIETTLRATQDDINVWVQNSEWDNRNVTGTVVENVVRNLKQQTPAASINSQKGILEIINEYFGLPPDFDGDRMTDFLIMDIQDGWEPGQGFIAGYFNPLDQYLNGTSVGQTRISGSNERDLLFIDSYPGIFNEGVYRYEEVMATVSHEYQHLVHFNYDRLEETYVNEGLSELSSYLCGYGLRNPSDYLRNSNLSLIQWNSDISEALKHYAKTALWTYYLFENFGVRLVKNIVNSDLQGMGGYQDALTRAGAVKSIEETVTDFFIAITINDSDINPAYGFNLDVLKELKANPFEEFYDFPTQVAYAQSSYSLLLITVENGDSLVMDFTNIPVNADVRVNKYGEKEVSFLNPLSGNMIVESDFGSKWSLFQFMSINSSGVQDFLSAQINAKQKYYVVKLTGNQDEPDLNISLEQAEVANRFSLPYDSCLIRSVRFYNQSSSAAMDLNIYADLTANNRQKLLTRRYNQVLSGDWVEFSLRDFAKIYRSGEAIDIGIGYTGSGAAGYSRAKITNMSSYLKTASNDPFTPLAQFKTDEETLDGTWMLGITYYAPLKFKPATNPETPLTFTINQMGPSPFPTPGNPAVSIIYTLSQPGELLIEIYDVLGRKVQLVFSGYETGPTGIKQWNGRNFQNNLVASGIYFLSISFGGHTQVRKIMFIK